jgi:hypothetical protein
LTPAALLDLHHMPQNRSAADLHYQLWTYQRLFTYVGAACTHKYYGFHNCC